MGILKLLKSRFGVGVFRRPSSVSATCSRPQGRGMRPTMVSFPPTAPSGSPIRSSAISAITRATRRSNCRQGLADRRASLADERKLYVRPCPEFSTSTARSYRYGDHPANDPMEDGFGRRANLLASSADRVFLILMMPRLLNYLIGIYLVLIGAMGLWPHIFTATVRALAQLRLSGWRRAPPEPWIRSATAAGRQALPRPDRNRDRAARPSGHGLPKAR